MMQSGRRVRPAAFFMRLSMQLAIEDDVQKVAEFL
jgi:hypothetical protein